MKIHEGKGQTGLKIPVVKKRLKCNPLRNSHFYPKQKNGSPDDG